MNQNISKSFFLVSFLPALAYWYLEAHYPIRVALAGGLLLAVCEIILERVFTKHIHAISKFNFFLILLLGGISLVGDEGIWFKLQPFFTGLIMGIYLIYRTSKGEGILYEMAQSMNQKNLPPREIMLQLEKHLAVFMLLYGFFMAAIAIWFSTDLWLFFKTAGFYITFFIFMIIEMVIMRVKMKKMMELNYKRQLFSNIHSPATSKECKR